MNTKKGTMYRDVWVKNHKAICSINFYGTNNSHLYGITGFRVGNKIITDDFIYNKTDVKEIAIRFYQEDGITEFAEVRRGYADFLNNIPAKKEFEHAGFAIIPADFPEFANTGSMKLSSHCSALIGQEAVSFGFQFEHKNLSLKSAMITSNYKNRKNLSFIQFDGTVKPGTTGGPLVNVRTGEVIGIVANKELKMTNNFLELMKIINSNLETLKEAEGKWKLDDIDPIQVLIANQNQIKHIVTEFFSNSTVRIGLALDIGHVTEYMESYHEIDVESSLL